MIVTLFGFGFPANFDSTMAEYRRQYKYTRGEDNYNVPPSHSIRDVVGRPYDESYEMARSSFVPPRGRGKRTTNARRSYNTKRTDAMRLSRGKDSMRQLSEALDAKLGVGLKEVEDALTLCRP